MRLIRQGNVLRFLTKPVYVVRMNFSQDRWTNEQRVKWLMKLQQACIDTMHEIDTEIRRYKNGVYDNHTD